MQSVSSRIWTRVAVSISYDDKHYTTDTSIGITAMAQFKLVKHKFWMSVLCMSICMTFKSRAEESNEQHVSAPTNNHNKYPPRIEYHRSRDIHSSHLHVAKYCKTFDSA